MIVTDRKQMHEELDRIIDEAAKSKLEGYYLPDLMIQWTLADEHQKESLLSIGVEFVEMEDGSLQVEERFIHIKHFDEWGRPIGADKHQEWGLEA